MGNQDDYEPSAGATYLFGSAPLFILGSMMLANINEEPAVFGTGAVLFFAVAVYLLLVGAIARGIQVARRGVREPAG